MLRTGACLRGRQHLYGQQLVYRLPLGKPLQLQVHEYTSIAKGARVRRTTCQHQYKAVLLLRGSEWHLIRIEMAQCAEVLQRKSLSRWEEQKLKSKSKAGLSKYAGMWLEPIMQASCDGTVLTGQNQKAEFCSFWKWSHQQSRQGGLSVLIIGATSVR